MLFHLISVVENIDIHALHVDAPGRDLIEAEVPQGDLDRRFPGPKNAGGASLVCS